MKHVKPIQFILLLVMTAGIATGAAAEFYHRAPDVLPWVKPEMMTTEYWIGRMEHPDEVVMPLDQILALNDDYTERMKSPDRFEGTAPERVPVQKDLDRWPGRFVSMPDLDKLKRHELSAIVRDEITHCIEFLRGKYLKAVLGREDVSAAQTFGNLLGIEYADWEIDELEAEMALDQVPDSTVVYYGIAVRNTQLRTVPNIKLERIGMFDSGIARWDVWNANIVRIGTPLSVLYASKSGGFVFVLSPDGYGWVRSEDVALGNRTWIKRFLGNVTDDGFVVCTGDMVPLYSDKLCRYTSGWLRLGDRLPLDNPDNPRIVKVPVRLTNGRFETATAWLAEDADVSVGYLPYTRRNVVELGFKLMGNLYDWSGGFMGRNHETWIRDTFACFGFRLPYHAELFTFYTNNSDRVVQPDEGEAAQKAAISENEPFITIQTCGGGHSQLYLGTVDGEPYVLDTTGYNYTDDDGTQQEVRRMTVCDMRIPQYFLKTPFMFCTVK